jgi:general stress protein 26
MSYLPLSFVQEKALDLENALFFSISESILKIPVCVVKVMQADEFGQLWFVIPRPAQHIYEFDRTFPAKLDFFKKGRDYFLKVLGNAFIVTDPEEINSIDSIEASLRKRVMMHELVLLKVKITHADYSEKADAKPSPVSLLKTIKSSVYKWFLHNDQQQSLTFERIPVNTGIPSPKLFSN